MYTPHITPLALRVLEGSLALIEQGWTQFTGARDIAGNSVSPQSPGAVSWCLIGAQQKTCDMLVGEGVAPMNDMLTEVDTAYNWLRRAWSESLGVSDYNDSRHRTKGEVVTLLKNAIADGRKELGL